jgi:hypothetical protein
VREARSRGVDWELGNAEDRNAENPRSFFIPSKAERDSLEVGSSVRLLFLVIDPPPGEPGGERMWLEVEGREDDRYIGALKNQPLAISDLAAGDLIAFGAEHVIAVDDPRWTPYEDKLAFVSTRLLEDERLDPGVVVHDPSDEQLAPRSDGTRASGWQLLVGDETDEELNQPGGIRVPNLAWLMERYPAFGDLVFSGAQDGEWVLDRTTGRYLRS